MNTHKPISRCAILINELYLGGAQRLAIDQAHEMRRRGIKVYFITLRKEHSASMRSDLRLEPDHMLEIPFSSFMDVIAWARLIGALRRIDPEFVMTHLWFSNVAGQISSWLCGVPSRLAFEHNVYDGVKSSRQFFFDRILQLLPTAIVAVSESIRASLIRNGISASRIRIVKNGVDSSRYQAASADLIRKELDLPPDAFVFLCVGRLSRQKGMDVLIRSLARVRGSAKLLIAGVGKEAETLKMLVRELGLERNVSFLGPRSDVPALLRAGDCFVLASRWEGLPIVVIEALLTQTPMIVSDFASAREIVPESAWSAIVPKEDDDALARAMQERLDRGRERAAYPKDVLDAWGIARNVDSLLSLLP